MTEGDGPASDVAQVAGWYGKLPTVGDFASRRLEADFVDPWDRWLGDGLQAQREALGEAWLDAFLHSPAWRFVLSAGALPGLDPGSVLAGVVMPSVDRVGRYFPLTLAGSIGRMPSTAAEFESVLAWIDRLENTALDALHSDWTIDELEDALSAMVPPSRALLAPLDDPMARARAALVRAMSAGGGIVDVAPVAHRADLASVFASALGAPSAPTASPWPDPGPARDLAGVAFWLADGTPSPQVLVSTGLPNRDGFLHMFGRVRDAAEGTAAVAVPSAAPASAAGFDSNVGIGIGEDTIPLRGPAPPVPALAPEQDLLALFDGTVDAPVSDPLAHAPPREDILSLFDATDADPLPDLAAPRVAPAEPTAGDDATRLDTPAPHDELLALFEKADPAAPRDQDAAKANADDILGLFGDAPPRRDPVDR